MKPNAIFIHGWGGTGDGIWMPAAREILKSKFTTHAPDFPNTDNPIYTEWRDHFDQYLGSRVNPATLQAEDIGIGHSLGAGFWFRYLLEKPEEPKNQRTGKLLKHLILVAPTPDDCGISEIQNFFDSEVDHPKIKSLVDRITIFGSNNDPYIPEIKFRILAEQLGAEFILIPQSQHLSGSPAAQAIGWPILLEYFKKLVG
ncbi:MAG TPA: alpha/beta hydrolase [Candidatus Gracilibacteria bacterium]